MVYQQPLQSKVKEARIWGPQAVALDSKNNIYVANSFKGGVGGRAYSQDQNVSITVYPAGSNGNVTPTTFIGGEEGRAGSRFGIAVDSAGNIYVATLGERSTTRAASG